MNIFCRAFAGVSFAVCVLVSCASGKTIEAAEGQSETKGEADFSAVQDQVWALMEVEAGETRIQINREGNQQPDVYTLRFSKDGRAAGKAAPNTYSGPYEAEGSGLRFPQTMAATRMLGLSASPGIGEDEYYGYLARASSWNIDGSYLRITSKTEEGQLAALIFAPVQASDAPAAVE